MRVNNEDDAGKKREATGAFVSQFSSPLSECLEEANIRELLTQRTDSQVTKRSEWFTISSDCML